MRGERSMPWSEVPLGIGKVIHANSCYMTCNMWMISFLRLHLLLLFQAKNFRETLLLILASPAQAVHALQHNLLFHTRHGKPKMFPPAEI
jgi:hypothetical protein